MKIEQYTSKLLYKSEHKQCHMKQQEKSRYCKLCRFQREQHQATATEFMQFTFSRNSFNNLDYSTVCIELSCTDKHGPENDPKGNKDCLKLGGGSSHQGFELARIKLQCTYEVYPGEIYYGLS